MFATIGIYSAIIWVVLWKGNEAIADLLDIKMDWRKQPNLRLIVSVLSHILFTIISFYIINYAVFHLFGWIQEIQSFQGLVRMSYLH